METLHIKGYTVEIHRDTDPMNPRTEWDNLGKMICLHKRYDLGDDHDIKTEWICSWNDLETYIRKELNAVVILPLYLYDHSGITIRTTPFSCPWDSGQIGFIYMDKKTALHNFKYKTLCKSLLKEAESMLLHEVKLYDQYLRGDVYGFQIKDSSGEVVESCWGFMGDDHDQNGLMEGVNDYINNMVAIDIWKSKQNKVSS